MWDGNVLLHEWSYPLSERPETVDSSEGKRSYASPEPQTELTTWIFDEGTFVPSAKFVSERRYSIISDYLGTPIQALDGKGEVVGNCLVGEELPLVSNFFFRFPCHSKRKAYSVSE